MPLIGRSALVECSARDMYRLVTDVESYPCFLPWCRAAAVHEQSEQHQTATIELARGPLRIRFTTYNRLHQARGIDMRLVSGPFKRLTGRWRFTPLDEGGCEVSLEMDFELSGSLVRMALGRLFHDMANDMVDAFCRRARTLHARE